MSKPRPSPPSKRTTEALAGTTSKTQAALSFPAEFALEFAQLWLTRAGSRTVPSSGLIRRALVVYAEHLHHQAQEEATGPAREVRAVSQACSASQVEAGVQRDALLRLHMVPPGERLPPLHELLCGPQALAELQQLEARVEAVVEQYRASPAFRLNAARSAKRATRLATATTTTQDSTP